MKLYVVRHGQTNWNVERKVQGKADVDLNLKGIEQAQITSQNLRNEKIDLIICSPLKRADQTAQIINEGRNIPLIYDERISERDYGELEGTKKEDFDLKGFWSYKSNYNYDRAENIRDFFERVYIFLDSVKKDYKDKNVLLVCHGGISMPIECYFNGIPEDDNLLKLELENCEIIKYDIEEIEDKEKL